MIAQRFASCRTEGCDNYLIAEVSQEEGICRQCAAQHDAYMAYYGRLYRASHPKGIPMTPEPTTSPSKAPAKPAAPCPTCQLPDGSPNTDYLRAEGSCVFGCGTVIDMDMGYCGTCRDHSANEVDCETCGKMWGDWHRGTWEVR